MVKRLKRDPAKEEAILRAAINEFSLNGYTASTDQIAQKAGVSKGSVFRYFVNKENLYQTAVKKALQKLDQSVDLTVWTDSTDLVDMIINAATYKLKLSHQYPDEFGLLMRVYLQEAGVPPELRKRVFQVYQKWTEQTIHKVVCQVIDKLPLRPELDHDLVTEYLLTMLNVLTLEIQKSLERDPQLKKIEDLDGLIRKIEKIMDMIEHGIVAS